MGIIKNILKIINKKTTNLSLAIKVSIIITTVIIIQFLIMGAFNFQQEINLVKDLQQKLATKLINTFAKISGDYMINYDYDSLEGFIRDAVKDKDIKYLYFKNQLGDEIALELDHKLLKSKLILHKSQLIFYDDEKIGEVFIGIDIQETQKQIQRLIFFVIIINCIGIVLMIVLIFFVLSSMVLKPINKLNDCLRNISSGSDDVSNKIDHHSNDEIGQLAKAFNTFLDRFILIINQANSISEGYYFVEIIPESKNDELGHALLNMTIQLQQVVSQANAIADGDFSIEIKPKSDKDALGNALLAMSNSLRIAVEQANAISKGDFSIEIKPKSDKDQLGKAHYEMTHRLREVSQTNERQMWLKDGQTELAKNMRGEQNISFLADKIISFLAEFLDAKIGTIYMFDTENKKLYLVGSYAFSKRKELANEFGLGEGIIGQVALEKKSIELSVLPDGYIEIKSSLGSKTPSCSIALPFLFEGDIKGVVELGFFDDLNKEKQEFLSQVMEPIAIALNSAQAREKMTDLLGQTQKQSEVLKSQQEELKCANEELQNQTEALKKSEESLKSQQEELQAANEELEEKSELLESQHAEIKIKNDDLNDAQKVLEDKAEELALASKYKSEFLANMSHELRTPLNSIIILSKLLSDNTKNNLNQKQVDSAATVYHSANDLLSLINEVLDLSKVESGKLDILVEMFPLSTILEKLTRNFSPIAQKKKVDFLIDIAKDIPNNMTSDEKRVHQIIKNFVSNSLKFTSKGEIRVSVFRPDSSVNLSRSGLNHSEAIAWAVSDTGIGIPKDKQKLIFEAFQQADGSTSRKYGGTGLGLSISRELAKILGGEIQISSEEGKGSIFTLYLPLKSDIQISSSNEKTMIPESTPKMNVPEKPAVELPTPPPITAEQTVSEPPRSTELNDDRDNITKKDKVILIIEDDPNFAQILTDIAREKGFKAILALDGESGLQLVQEHLPHAIILDVLLPGISGWMVMDKLQENPATRHIPIHFISGIDYRVDALKRGAVGFLQKPVGPDELDSAFGKIRSVIKKDIKDLLIIEDDAALQESMKQLLESKDIIISQEFNGKSAIEALNKKSYDCVILDIGLPDISGFELLEQLQSIKMNRQVPVLIYTGKELTKDELNKLKKYSQSIIVKDVNSQERLLDETSLFLHRVEAKMPKEMKKTLQGVYNQELLFKNKTVLVVDDDMRNTFSLEMLLSEHGMSVLMAENGLVGIKQLEEHPEINLVLMDIMMPEMNGYEAMTEIRKHDKWRDLPILAVTAKAMVGDREKCIEAGANDYLSKPVQYDKLLSLMRIWLR